MHGKMTFAAALLGAVLSAAACSTSAAGPTAPSTTTPVAVATLIASAVPEATPANGPASEAPPSSAGGAQPTPGDLDPCTLLTAEEASTAIGKKLGAGVSTKLDPDRVCTFKNGLTEVKLILAPPAPDAATAQAYWDAGRAQVPAEFPITDLSEFDRSAYGKGTAAGASISALFVIHGTTFFDLYCGFPACSQSASVTAAQLIVGRLP